MEQVVPHQPGQHAEDEGTASTTTSETRGAARRTTPSSPAASARVIQCWIGNVNAAPAKAHCVHSTETGAAASAPRPRVISANRT